MYFLYGLHRIARTGSALSPLLEPLGILQHVTGYSINSYRAAPNSKLYKNLQKNTGAFKMLELKPTKNEDSKI